MHQFLIYAVVFLAAAVLAVPLFQRLGLASVLGYLAAGALLGPQGFKLSSNPLNLMEFAEIGVVMLLFLIGLEMKPSRLWTMRKQVFGLGSLQVAVTSVLLAALGLVAGLSPLLSILVGLALSLSSTAFSLQILSERNQVNTHYGRMTFSILLFQDLAAIPLLAVLPFLSAARIATDPSAAPGTAANHHQLIAFALAIVIIAVLPFALRLGLRIVAATRIRELFTATTLFLVLGLALLMHEAGLSMALGSFIGGILLSDSEYRHQLEADIEPFKGLLLGLFFMAIGMGVNFHLLLQKPLLILGLVTGFMIVKSVVTYALGRVGGMNGESSLQMAFILPQGGEFAFVIFSVALAGQLITTEQSDLFNLLITLSMALTPLGILLNDKLFSKLGKKPDPIYDQIPSTDAKIIVAGVGRFGQIITRTLRMLDIPFTALEQDPEQVQVLRRFGSTVFYGDASRLDLLESAGARRAEYFICCIDDMDAGLKAVDMVQANFPHLKIFARARNREHAFHLLDRGVKVIYREVLGSSLEMAESLLVSLGYPKAQAQATMARFRVHDHETLFKQHAVHNDEKLLISTSKEAAQQLTELLRADKEQPAVSSL